MTATRKDLQRKVRPRKRYRPHPKITPEMILPRIWYALRVKPQTEFQAQDVLSDMGLLTYVPVRKEWRYRTRFDRPKKKNKELVSYPEARGYLFAGWMPEQLGQRNIPHWLKLFDLPMISGAVGISGRPMPLHNHNLIDLSARFPNGLQKPKHEAYMRTHAEFKEGDLVMICEGPFTGHEVPVVEINDQKTKVVIDLFNEAHETWIETFSLEKAR